MIKNIKIIFILLFGIVTILPASAEDTIAVEPGVAFDMGFGVTALINDKFNVMVGNDGFAADYQFKKGTFNAKVPFTWYIAGGGYSEWGEGFGARLPLGLNIQFQQNLQNWNAYTQIAPDIDLNDEDDDIKFGAQLAVGLRYSF